MSQLDHLLDDALAGFDDDDGFTFPESRGASRPDAASPSAGTASSSGRTAGAAPQQAQAPSSSSSSSIPGSGSAALSSQAVPGSAAAPAAIETPSSSTGSSGSKPFDPLKRKSKGKVACLGAAAGLAGGGLGSSSKRPAITPEVHKLQEDLAKLMSEWSTAMHPEADQPSQPAAGQQQGVSAVLAALAEQTKRTVEEQSKLRPPPAGAAAAAEGAAGGSSSGGGGGGGGGEQMNMIVDVVMQHLLSKEVLYQPMKEIMDKYPPWLEKQASSSSSSLSPGELERYQQQYACIRRLCGAYEAEPDNTSKIMELLQEMQACGEPPAEIVEEMSAAIAADLPADAAAAGGGAGGLGFDSADLEGLGELPPEFRNCPVQ